MTTPACLPARPRDVARPGEVARPWWLISGGLVAGAVAWWVVASLPPMHVRVGREAIEQLVPVGYQVSVFPAFAAFVAALALDVRAGAERRTWWSRAGLILATGVLATIRLAGAIPLSGHAVFLAAVLAYELTRPAAKDAHVLSALVLPALLVTGWYKIVVWGDAGWLVVSLAAGAAIGWVLARRRRARRSWDEVNRAS